jgi:HAD superfamily hydrolase (TIGR01484 family)
VNYKALILDLDGTTVASKEGSLPSIRVKKAVKQAKKFMAVTVATGRPLSFAKDVTDALDINAPCVFNGGAEIINPKTMETFFAYHLSIEKQKAVCEICKDFQVNLYTDTTQYEVPVTNTTQIVSETAKLFVDNIEIGKANELLWAINSITGVEAHKTTSWSEGNVVDLHITDAQATKKHGIAELLKILRVKKSETIGIGDFYNDLPLLESVGLRIVMGSAPEDIKAIADHVVADLEHDGVAEAIERFVLNTKYR